MGHALLGLLNSLLRAPSQVWPRTAPAGFCPGSWAGLWCGRLSLAPFSFVGMNTPSSSPQHRPAVVSPLSLSTEARRQQAQQVSPTLSPLSPITQAVAMDALSLEQQLPYAFFTQAGSQQPPPQPQPPPPPPPVPQQQPPPPQVSVGLPQGGPLLPSASLTRGPQLPPLSVTVPSTLPQSPTENPGQPPMGIDATSVSLRGVPGPSVCVYP